MQRDAGSKRRWQNISTPRTGTGANSPSYARGRFSNAGLQLSRHLKQPEQPASIAVLLTLAGNAFNDAAIPSNWSTHETGTCWYGVVTRRVLRACERRERTSLWRRSDLCAIRIQSAVGATRGLRDRPRQ